MPIWLVVVMVDLGRGAGFGRVAGLGELVECRASLLLREVL